MTAEEQRGSEPPVLVDDLFMPEIIQCAPEGARVLDLGCGQGSVDYSVCGKLRIFPADFLCWLREKTPSEIRSRFVRLDSCRLPYKDGVFDVCLCNFVFEHVKKPVNMIQEIDRVIRLGGLLYVSIPNSRGWEERLYGLLHDNHINKYTFKSFLEMTYSNTGFKLVSYCNWPAGHTYLAGKCQMLQVPLFYILKVIGRLLNQDLLAENNYLFLFRKEAKRGLRVMDATCRKCGGGHMYKDEKPKWTCETCGTVNIKM
ncbi:MAG: hypothetical protein Kow0099_14940 [Candidatus Abyssubacteria bacterium]